MKFLNLPIYSFDHIPNVGGRYFFKHFPLASRIDYPLLSNRFPPNLVLMVSKGQDLSVHSQVLSQGPHDCKAVGQALADVWCPLGNRWLPSPPMGAAHTVALASAEAKTGE